MPTAQRRYVLRATPAKLTGVRGRPTLASAAGITLTRPEAVNRPPKSKSDTIKTAIKVNTIRLFAFIAHLLMSLLFENRGDFVEIDQVTWFGHQFGIHGRREFEVNDRDFVSGLPITDVDRVLRRTFDLRAGDRIADRIGLIALRDPDL